jgi:hypothetical protein
MCASAWNCAPELYLVNLVARQDKEKCHIQTKTKYILSLPTPQKICSRTIFSQSLVQLAPKKNFAEETSQKFSFVCASIGNVQ